jgi:hypothetical protein
MQYWYPVQGHELWEGECLTDKTLHSVSKCDDLTYILSFLNDEPQIVRDKVTDKMLSAILVDSDNYFF